MNPKKYSFVFAGSSQISLDCLKLLLSIPQLQLKALLTQPDRFKGRGLKKQSSEVKAFAESCWTPQSLKISSSEKLSRNKTQKQICWTPQNLKISSSEKLSRNRTQKQSCWTPKNLKISSSEKLSRNKTQKQICWTPQSLKDEDFLKQVAQQKADFCFVCAYGQILPESYLQLFHKKSLNLHFSLLPKWRGAAPVQRSLMAGDKKTGVSLQIMSKKMDAGDIISFREFAIADTDNAQTVFKKSLQHTADILKKDLIPYLEGRLEPQAQDHSQATYADKIQKSMAFIDFSQSASVIHNQIRALVLGPQAFGFIKGQRLKIYQSQVLQAHPDTEKKSPQPREIESVSHLKKKSPQPNEVESVSHLEKKSPQPGEVCYQDKNKLYIQCGSGILSLLEVQKEGKKRQNITEFLKGFPLKIGDRLD